jgi:hypothetical protein
MNRGRLVAGLVALLLVVSLSANVLMLLRLRALSAGSSLVEFYGAVGSDKAVGVFTGPLMVKLFGSDWREQRIYLRTDQAGHSLYHGNFSLVPGGTFPVVFSTAGSPGQYTLYSADRKLTAAVTVDFAGKSARWYVPKDQPVWHETILPDGELMLKKQLPAKFSGP